MSRTFFLPLDGSGEKFPDSALFRYTEVFRFWAFSRLLLRPGLAVVSIPAPSCLVAENRQSVSEKTGTRSGCMLGATMGSI